MLKRNDIVRPYYACINNFSIDDLEFIITMHGFAKMRSTFFIVIGTFLLKKFNAVFRTSEKGRDLTQSYDKSPYTDRKIHVTTQTRHQKLRLYNDCEPT